MKYPFDLSISLCVALVALFFSAGSPAAQVPTGVVQDKATATTNVGDYAALPIGFNWRLLDRHHAEIYFDKPKTYKDFNYLVTTASQFNSYNNLLGPYSAPVVSAINQWALNNDRLVFTVKCGETSCTAKLNYKKVCVQKTCTLPDSFANLTLTGKSRLNGTGNVNDNVMRGSSAANTLLGLAGNDTLKGEGGKDTLVDEEGSNTLKGGSGDDSLSTGAGNDVLNGGPGNDSLQGGLGSDQFKFGDTLNAKKNVDTIAEFTPGADQILLSHTIFSIPHKYMGKKLGTITDSAQLESGPGQKLATSRSTRLIYDTSSGTIYYDPDGSGSTAPTRFAVLLNVPVMTITDFALF